MFFEKFPKWARFLFYILVPFFTYSLVEWLQGSYQSPIGANFWLNMLFYYGLFFIIYGIFKNPFLYALIPGVLMWVLGTVSHYMISLRNKALLPWELAALSTAKNVGGDFDINLNATVVLTSLIFIIICILAWLLRKNNFKIKRVYPAVLGILMLSCLWLILLSPPRSVSSDPWYTVDASRQNGVAMNIVHNMKSLINPAPEGYSTQRVREIIGESEKEGSMTPDIIVIMDESFADLSQIADLKSERDYLPFYHSIRENAITGSARVSVFGGGTCNTEYEFLTGNATPLLRAGSYPMVQFVSEGDPSIATSLKAQGYRTIGLHSFYPDGWNRDTSYPRLGFDKFLSNRDFENPEMVREYISDAASFDKIIELLEEDDSPAFIFNVTMQNHFGYDRAFDNLEETARFPEMEKFPQAKRYFSLISLTDKALEDFINYLENRDKPTILLFFGDHLPSFEWEYYDVLKERAGLSDDEMEIKKHTVPFFIWANYPIEEKHDVEISSSFLSALLLDAAGVKMTEHQRYLLDLTHKMPLWESGDGENLEGYKMVQYNMMFDKSNKQGDLFE